MEQSLINFENFIEVKRVAKVYKSIGEFIMFKCSEGENLLVTNHFALNLESEQFWKVQCALEIPEYGIWYAQQKEGLEVSNRDYNPEELERDYQSWIRQDAEKIENTKLILREQYRLYQSQNRYTAINVVFIDMLKNPLNFWRADKQVIVDGIHILTPAHDEVWQENEFLVRKGRD